MDILPISHSPDREAGPPRDAGSHGGSASATETVTAADYDATDQTDSEPALAVCPRRRPVTQRRACQPEAQ